MIGLRRTAESLVARTFGEYVFKGASGLRHRPVLPEAVQPGDGFRGRTMARGRTRGADRIERANHLLCRTREVEAFFRSDAPEEEKGTFIEEYDRLLAEWDELEAEILENDQDRAGFRLPDGSWISLRNALAFVMKYRDVLDLFGGVVVAREQI